MCDQDGEQVLLAFWVLAKTCVSWGGSLVHTGLWLVTTGIRLTFTLSRPTSTHVGMQWIPGSHFPPLPPLLAWQRACIPVTPMMMHVQQRVKWSVGYGVLSVSLSVSCLSVQWQEVYVTCKDRMSQHADLPSVWFSDHGWWRVRSGNETTLSVRIEPQSCLVSPRGLRLEGEGIIIIDGNIIWPNQGLYITWDPITRVYVVFQLLTT